MLTVINTQAPLHSDSARNALDMIMMAVSLDQAVQVIFSHDGVYQLLAQQASALDNKNPLVKYRVLADIFEMDSLYVLDSALSERHLAPEQLSIKAQLISTEQMAELIAHSDKVVRF
ncbi:DsrE family protein [Aliidiomarina maris]|uniref:tRNA 2-thiouridine synthesizing protein C n=1 Tax=Aliidiomarina maris TaxID=531312 RepID=A0A327WWZ6_9GAMM|nr:DsrE family protein [Aliidiomarina maris]MBA3988992.1 hypothetical protein [Idiomarina sp.]MCL5050948.1 DsrE family protein [Bacillota bacterium]RAJ96440.1 tRNA 2-thiouridine synthesizing protein C [Aliidiomarina maris]RUO23806.1 hypothetical protein CWE07_09875 [Aliidiomarina maris]